MSDTRRYASIPPLTLSADLSASGSVVKTTTAVDWDGNALASSLFNTDYIPATLINDTRTRVEFILIDVSTIGTLTTTGATIYKRGLPFTATGNDATDETELTARKEFWTQGETKLLLGTNPPHMYGSLANRKNDELIVGAWTFTETALPRSSAAHTYGPGEEEYFATKRYVDGVVTGGAADANTTTKGLVEEATQAEIAAGTAAGGTTARLFTNPSTLAAHIQSGSWIYAIEDGTGSDDAYTASITPTLTAYTAGMIVGVKFTVANTTAATININAVGVKDIKKFVAGAIAALETGDIVAGQLCLLIYDGTQFLLLNPSATMPTTAILTEMVNFFTDTNGTGANNETLTDGATSNADTLHTHTNISRGFDVSWGFTSGAAQIKLGDGIIAGFSDAAAVADKRLALAGHSTSAGEDVLVLSVGIANDYGFDIYPISKTFSDNFGNTQGSYGVVYIGTDRWEAVSSTNIYKNGGAATGDTAGVFGPLGHDPTNSRLLCLYSTTKIARFTGIAGTALTDIGDVTLDTAVTQTVGFVYDNTNSRYICIDKTANVIRRFNSSGVTIDTVAYTCDDTYLAGLAIINSRVYLVFITAGATDSATNNDGGSGHAKLIPTTMTI
jgi:hypothetical protein